MVAGRYLTPNARDEILLGQGFADAHRLRPGDAIAAVVNGRWQRLQIAGIANSPEFVYVLSGAAILPDNKRYGVMWMNRSALGTIPATRRVLALPPAEAMRPEPPPRFRKLFLERIGYVHLIAPATRMMFRNLERRPLRALASTLAIALSCALLIVGQFGLDALDETVRIQFRAARRDDIRLGFHEPRGEIIRHDLASLSGVLQAEAFRVVGARIRYGPASKRIGLFGLPPDATLHRVLDIGMREVAIPQDGLVLSASLAVALRASPGDQVEIEILEGDRRKRMLMLQRVVDKPIGMSGYMDIGALAKLMDEGPTYSDAYLRVDPHSLDELYGRIKTLPVVSSIALREATLKSFLATIGENLAVSMSVLIGFAAMIAAGVVFNGARIALSEHAMTLVSLRILGFRQREVTAMLLGEQAIVTVAAIPVGFAIGYWTCALIAYLLATELYRVPLVVSGRTYAWSALAIIAAASASGLIVAWRARRLDLIAVLKTRE